MNERASTYTEDQMAEGRRRSQIIKEVGLMIVSGVTPEKAVAHFGVTIQAYKRWKKLYERAWDANVLIPKYAKGSWNKPLSQAVRLGADLWHALRTLASRWPHLTEEERKIAAHWLIESSQCWWPGPPAAREIGKMIIAALNAVEVTIATRPPIK